jgi:hypothetical protein
MVEIIEVDASHEEAQEAKEEQEEISEPVEAEKEAEKPEEKSKDLQSALAQKDHYRTKLEKSEAEKKSLEDKLKGFSSQTTGDPMESVALGKALADVSLEEAETIITYAKGKFNNLKPTPEQIIQASKDPWVIDAIKTQREKVKAENKTPAPSSPSSTIRGKTSEDIAKMDTKSFSKLAREIFQGGGTGI